MHTYIYLFLTKEIIVFHTFCFATYFTKKWNISLAKYIQYEKRGACVERMEKTHFEGKICIHVYSLRFRINIAPSLLGKLEDGCIVYFKENEKTIGRVNKWREQRRDARAYIYRGCSIDNLLGSRIETTYSPEAATFFRISTRHPRDQAWLPSRFTCAS